jgi:hypothetical protein
VTITDQTCLRCGGAIIGRRADARWCSDACRKGAARDVAEAHSQAFWRRLAAIRRPTPVKTAPAARRADTPDKARTGNRSAR